MYIAITILSLILFNESVSKTSVDKNLDPEFRKEILKLGQRHYSKGEMEKAAKYFYYGKENWRAADQQDDRKLACKYLFNTYYRVKRHKKFEQKLHDCPRDLLDTLYGRVDRNNIPIYKTAPIIPKKAWRNGTNGVVLVEYTIDKKGKPKNIKILESSDKLFNKTCIAATKKFIYLPRIKNGVVVESPGIKNRFTIKVPQGDDRVNPPITPPRY